MDVFLGIVLEHSIAWDGARQWIGLLLAVLCAAVAAQLGWQIVDRLMTLRQRTDED